MVYNILYTTQSKGTLRSNSHKPRRILAHAIGSSIAQPSHKEIIFTLSGLLLTGGTDMNRSEYLTALSRSAIHGVGEIVSDYLPLEPEVRRAPSEHIAQQPALLPRSGPADPIGAIWKLIVRRRRPATAYQ